jgi:hypothetical protein
MYYGRRSPLVQGPLWVLILLIHQLRRACASLSDNTDEPSTFKALTQYFDGVLMRLQRSRVRYVRCDGWRTMYFIQAYIQPIPHNFLVLVHRLRDESLGSALGGEWNDLMAALREASPFHRKDKEKRAAVQLTKMWDSSTEKQPVKVSWRANGWEDSPVRLGEVLIDVDAPLAVMREKIRQAFCRQLNTRSGEAFLFVVEKGPVLRVNEISTRTKDSALAQMNPETTQIEFDIYICTDHKAKVEKIPDPEGDSGEGEKQETERPRNEENAKKLAEQTRRLRARAQKTGKLNRTWTAEGGEQQVEAQSG